MDTQVEGRFPWLSDVFLERPEECEKAILRIRRRSIDVLDVIHRTFSNAHERFKERIEKLESDEPYGEMHSYGAAEAAAELDAGDAVRMYSLEGMSREEAIKFLVEENARGDDYLLTDVREDDLAEARSYVAALDEFLAAIGRGDRTAVAVTLKNAADDEERRMNDPLLLKLKFGRIRPEETARVAFIRSLIDLLAAPKPS